MLPCRRALAGSAVLVLVLAAGCGTPTSSPSPTPAASTTAGPTPTPAATALAADTSALRGVNWADPRDNFASDALVPSGLDARGDYEATYRRATTIVAGFRSTLGATTVRLPVNPASVGTAWWRSYKGAIDAAAEGGTVILSYWEAADSKDGRIDDPAAYDAMWDTVVARYGSYPRVYFEPMNEPHGYTLDVWVGLATEWLARHPDVPRSRVIVSGTGYNDDVTGVGAAPELAGTLLSFHCYGYYADLTTEAAWKAAIPTRIGPYGYRTVIDEAGAPMSTGLDYDKPDGNRFTSFFAALTETAREQRMGVVYWPGLRTGDAYALTTLTSDDRLRVTNRRALARLQWGWGLRDTEPGR